jgi:hypothetical protein
MEIVETLLATTGMRPSEIRWRTVDSEYPPLPFMYQRNESSFDFMLRVLASQGIFFYFEHATALPPSMSGDAGASASLGVSGGGFGASVSAGAASSPATSDGVTVLNFARRASDTPALAATAPTTLAVGPFGVALSLPGVSVNIGAGGSGGGSASSGTLLFDDAMGTDSSDERIYEFALKKQLRTQTLQLLERQVANGTNWVGQGVPAPSSAPSSSAPSLSVSIGLGGFSATASAGPSVPFDVDTTRIPADVLREELYQVDPNLTETTQDPKLIDNPQMDLELARARRQYVEGHGKSDCRRLSAGYRFTLAGHTIPALNGEYTITSVECEGYNPDFVVVPLRASHGASSQAGRVKRSSVPEERATFAQRGGRHGARRRQAPGERRG